MSVLDTTQGDLADLLGAALSCKAFPYIPERMIAPSVVVVPSSPWVISGNTYGKFVAAFDVEIVVQTAANSMKTKDLTDRVEEAIVTAVNEGYEVVQVEQPSALEANGAAYMSATIQIQTQVSL